MLSGLANDIRDSKQDREAAAPAADDAEASHEMLGEEQHALEALYGSSRGQLPCRPAPAAASPSRCAFTLRCAISCASQGLCSIHQVQLICNDLMWAR